MPYTTEDGGRLNNFANEPKMYEAQAPDQRQKLTYLFVGTGAVAFVSALVYVAFSVS